MGGDGNLQSVFSSLDIMWVLYDTIIHFDKELGKGRDVLLLSKGQASLGLYLILAEKGILSTAEVESFCKFNSRFGMQIDRTKFSEAGLETSAGSLGHGLPMAVGMCIANKIQKSSEQVYVLVGDGEFNEGTMWESVILASHKNLDNLCIIIDDNNSIGNLIGLDNMNAKLSSFGFLVREVNGHNHNELKDAFNQKHNGQPLAVIAKTMRGYGSKSMINDSKWFHRAPNKEELAKLIEEVDQFESSNV